jgi:hypothetical protein
VSTAKALRAAIGSGRGCSQRSSFLGALRLRGVECCVRDLVEAGDRFRPRGSGEVHVMA